SSALLHLCELELDVGGAALDQGCAQEVLGEGVDVALLTLAEERADLGLEGVLCHAQTLAHAAARFVAEAVADDLYFARAELAGERQVGKRASDSVVR